MSNIEDDLPPLDGKIEARDAVERFDTEKIAESVEALCSIPELRPEVWETLDLYARVSVLQEVENRLAIVHQRDTVEVVGEKMSSSTLGYWDGHSIHLNFELIAHAPIDQLVDTVAHEGRHAYQAYILEHPDNHPDLETVVAWALNSPPAGTYFSADDYGYEIYRAQPLEVDAWNFGQSVSAQLYSQLSLLASS